MRNPHERSAVATNCHAVGVELFRQLREQAGDGSSASDRNLTWPQEMVRRMSAKELRLVLSAFEDVVRDHLAGRLTQR